MSLVLFLWEVLFYLLANGSEMCVSVHVVTPRSIFRIVDFKSLYSSLSFQRIPELLASGFPIHSWFFPSWCDNFYLYRSLTPCCPGRWTQASKVLWTSFEVPAGILLSLRKVVCRTYVFFWKLVQLCPKLQSNQYMVMVAYSVSARVWSALTDAGPPGFLHQNVAYLVPVNSVMGFPIVHSPFCFSVSRITKYIYFIIMMSNFDKQFLD